MSGVVSLREERLDELLSARAFFGLTPAEEAELADLLREFPGRRADDLDRAAAAVALAGLSAAPAEPLPAHLAAALEAASRGALAQTPATGSIRSTAPLPGASPRASAPPARPSTGSIRATMPLPGASPPRASTPPPMAPPSTGSLRGTVPLAPNTRSPSTASLRGAAPMTGAPPAVAPVSARPGATNAARGSRVVMLAGWIAAAACLALVAWTWLARPAQPTAANASKGAIALRDELLAAKGALRGEWSATADPASRGASGDVVWDPSSQRGAMRFRGLAKNDPGTTQYQLWIFDKTRDERYPVDGGVFDVDRDTGDVVVAIHAQLAVRDPGLFAITAERPGGVVVSSRERIVVTATPKPI